MTRVAVIKQTYFLPGLHYLQRIVDADVFVLMDDHQFGPHWQKRTLIKTSQGIKYLTVPIQGGQRQHIQDVKIAHVPDCFKRIVASLKHNYRRAPFYDQVMDDLVPLLYGYSTLHRLNRALIAWLLVRLRIPVEIVEQSKLGTFTETKTDLMVAVTKAVGADTYLSGKESFEQFYEMDKFEDAGVHALAQDWVFPEYRQLWGEFVPYLSVIDALFNVGFEGTRKILETE